MKRLLFTFKLLAILLVVDACLKCDEVYRPYFDFKTLSVYSSEPSKEVQIGSEFNFRVNLESVYYLASGEYSLGFINSSLAREECLSNGYLGYKYGLDSITVKSSGTWDLEHSAGASLNDIVYARQWWADEDGFELLSEYNSVILRENRSIEFQIKTSPTEDLKHIFHITYYKSNGEIVEGTTDTITWVP